MVYALTANAELFDEVQVSLAVFGGNVLQSALALANHLQQATASGKVFFVDLEVLGEFLDAFGHDARYYGG